jgi:deoxyribose-phosphate aldolase
VTPNELARYIDHTLLKPEATQVAVAALCDEAMLYNVAAVCVSPSMLPLNAGILKPEIAICTVVGFPSGAVDSRIKAAEASLAFASGAFEIDMVANLGFIKLADWDALETEILAVSMAVPFATLKVILETAALTEPEIVEACRVAESAGADYVKTSTGFHPNGGASLETVALMARTIGGSLGIKASGGIRDTATALAMIDAGATRIGTSSTAAILGGLA